MLNNVRRRKYWIEFRKLQSTDTLKVLIEIFIHAKVFAFW